jgi:hypothetical protein
VLVYSSWGPRLLVRRRSSRIAVRGSETVILEEKVGVEDCASCHGE